MPRINHAATQSRAGRAPGGNSNGSARQAVAVLKRHFGFVLGAEKVVLGEEGLRSFRAASLAILRDKQALATLGIALVDLLMAHYVRQLDEHLAEEARRAADDARKE